MILCEAVIYRRKACVLQKVRYFCAMSEVRFMWFMNSFPLLSDCAADLVYLLSYHKFFAIHMARL